MVARMSSRTYRGTFPAADRARTIEVASGPAFGPDAISSPGHVFPLIAQRGGTLIRPGHAEAAVDVSRLAGLNPAGVICEIMKDDGAMARLPDVLEFAALHGLKVGTIADLMEYRLVADRLVQRASVEERRQCLYLSLEWSGRGRLCRQRGVPRCAGDAKRDAFITVDGPDTDNLRCLQDCDPIGTVAEAAGMRPALQDRAETPGRWSPRRSAVVAPEGRSRWERGRTARNDARPRVVEPPPAARFDRRYREGGRSGASSRQGAEAECILAVIDAIPEGREEFAGLHVGIRGSARRWREFLVPLKCPLGRPDLRIHDGFDRPSTMWR